MTDHKIIDMQVGESTAPPISERRRLELALVLDVGLDDVVVRTERRDENGSVRTDCWGPTGLIIVRNGSSIDVTFHVNCDPESVDVALGPIMGVS